MVETTRLQTMSNKQFYILTGVLLAIVAVGAVAWYTQITEGLIVTGMRNIISWGLYISTFAWFVGISAGGLILSSSSQVFGIKSWEKISPFATLLALIAIAMAALSILPDLGRPDRVLNLFLYPQFLSPLVWDLFIIATYLVLSALDLFFMLRHRLAKMGSRLALIMDASEASARRDAKAVKVISFVALPVAILTHSITAWIFGLQISRPYWNTALLAPLFLASAMASGLALVLFTMIGGKRFFGLKVETKLLSDIGKLLSVIVLVDLFLLLSEYITTIWPGVPSEVSSLDVVFFGPYGYLAWIQWGCALLAVALLIYPRTRRSLAGLFSAATLIMFEVFIYRLDLVIPAYVNPLVQFPPGTSIGEFVQGSSSFMLAGSYFPTVIEWAIVMAILAASLLLLTIAYRILPLNSSEPTNSTTSVMGSPTARAVGEEPR
jgi:molybdopterin-containing oxidoreductase family membrane subunit